MAFAFSKSPTQLVVGGVMLIALLVVIFHLVGVPTGIALSALLLYEAWTILNRFPNDTISEIVWELSARPLVPLLFGVATGWAIGSGVIATTKAGVWLALCIGTLLGHFFWQKKGE